MHRTPSIKLPWIMLILAFPVAGIVFYLIVGMNRSTKTMRNRYKKIDEVLLPLLPDNADVQKKLAEKNRHVAGITHYLKKYSGYPVYNNTDIIYYDDAAKGLEAQKEDFERIFEVSNEVTDYYASGRGAFLRFSQLILRLAAPLMCCRIIAPVPIILDAFIFPWLWHFGLYYFFYLVVVSGNLFVR